MTERDDPLFEGDLLLTDEVFCPIEPFPEGRDEYPSIQISRLLYAEEYNPNTMIELNGGWVIVGDVNNKPIRVVEGVYPNDPSFDPDGSIALDEGGRYYDEGMGYFQPEFHELRVDCFRAAELLYLHSAKHGNELADLCLGYVYSYNRCEGAYWNAEAFGLPYPIDERAFDSYSRAAKTGNPEALYKTGDMLQNGRGCQADPAAAYSHYVRAYENGSRSPVVWGSAAFRLAKCYEQGLGCERDFSEARQWYQLAVTGLKSAVDSGAWYYQKVLASAQSGLARMQQETGFGDWRRRV